MKEEGTFGEWFLECFARVNGKRIRLYPYQRKVLRDSSRKRIINKARQVGVSWLCACEGLLKAMQRPNCTVLFVSNSQKNANRILQYIYDLVASLPKKLKPPMTEAQSKTEIGFANKSRVISLPNNPNTVRGYAGSLVYVDEIAHFSAPGDEDMLRALAPSISRGQQLTLFSTPFGKRNTFYDVWEKDSEYSHHQIDWTMCPDEEYRRNVAKEKKEMDPLSFASEYCCGFVGEQTAFFPFEVTKRVVSEDLFLWDTSSEIDTSNPVFVGVDFGKLHSSTVITVIEEVKEKAVTRYIKEYERTEYTQQLRGLKRVMQAFPVTKALVDQTGIGIRLFEELKQVYGAKVIPITFTLASKERMITNLRVMMEDGRVVIPKNERLISQLQTLEREISRSGNLRFRHQVGKRDDYVWSLALACDSAQREHIEDLIWFGAGNWTGEEVEEKEGAFYGAV